MSEVATQDFTTEEAREFVDHVRASVEDLKDWIVRAVKGRAWIALGYDSWDGMCEVEFDGAVIRLPREDRREAVASLREAGLSTRAIGSALGVDDRTVRRDSTAANAAVPETVTPLDGRGRPAAPPPRPDPGPAPEPGFWFGGPPEPDEPHAEDDAPPAARPEPSPAVADYVASDPAWQDKAYLAAFTKAITRSDDFMEFDPVRLAEIAPERVADGVDQYLTRVEQFVAKFRAARTGLRVIKGGSQ